MSDKPRGHLYYNHDCHDDDDDDIYINSNTVKLFKILKELRNNSNYHSVGVCVCVCVLCNTKPNS